MKFDKIIKTFFGCVLNVGFFLASLLYIAFYLSLIISPDAKDLPIQLHILLGFSLIVLVALYVNANGRASLKFSGSFVKEMWLKIATLFTGGTH